LESNEPIAVFIDRLTSAFETLEVRGQELHDEFKGSYLIGAIEDSARYAEFRDDLISVKGKDYNETIAFLIAEDTMRNSKRIGKKVKPAVAFETRPIERKTDKSKVKCFKCNDYGHYAKECSSSGSTSGSTTASSSPTSSNSNSPRDEVCLFCGKKGHNVQVCRKMLSVRDRMNEKKAETVAGEVVCNVSVQKEYIGLDSCASQHICGDRDLLENIRRGNPMKVTLGTSPRR
jgi:hypothetical protein